MKFSKQDQKDYAAYLKSELTVEQAKTESIFTNHNIFNITKDLNNMNLTINK
jgi:hypothetical protein